MSSFEEAKRRDYALARANQALFHSAIQHCMDGNLSELQKDLAQFLKECGPEFVLKDVVLDLKSEGKTLIHIAASAGQVDVLTFLLDVADNTPGVVDLADEKGMTPLINATISESQACMELLLEKGANPNLRNADGACALHFAAGDGSLPRMDLLLNHGADPTFQSQSGTALHWAAGKGHHAALARLLAHPSGRSLLDTPNAAGVPAVLMAAVSGSDEAVCVLVEAGADVGAVLAGGVTLLHVCAEHGLGAAVEAILKTETGRRCAALATEEGNTPILLAAMAGHADIVRLLLPPGGGPDAAEALLAEGRRRMAAYEAAQAASKQHAEASGDLNLEQPAIVGEEAKRAAEAAKQRGNEAFHAHRLAEAAEHYSEAIRCDKYCAAYYSNRCAVFMALGEHEQALRDAEACRRLDPSWPKGAYRLAAARLALGLFEDAALAAFEGCKLDPNNGDLKALLQEAVRKGQEDHKRKLKAVAKA